MSKYPFVKQEEQKDCASSCILMILKYYGAYVSMEELRDETKTNKNGVNIYDLVETLKKYGFDAEALKGSIDELKNEDITFPFISHMKTNNGHFIVVYEINYKKNKMVIGDPGTKLKTITINEFLNEWNNIIIKLERTRKLPYRCEKISVKDYVIHYIQNQKSSIVTICLFSFTMTIFTIITTYYFQFIIDGINKNKTNSYFLLLFIIFLSLGIVKEITNFMKNKVYNYVKYNLDVEMNYDVYKKIIYLPFKYYADRSIGDILSRINNLNTTKNFICDIILNCILGTIISIVALILLIATNKDLTLLAIINIGLYGLLTFIFNHYFKEKIVELQSIKSSELSYLTETVTAYNTVKGINLYKYVLKNYKNKLRELSYKYLNLNDVKEIEQLFKNLISVVFNILILYLGAGMIKNKELTIGGLITFNYLYGYMLEPLKTIIDSNININEMKSAIKRIIDLYYYEEDDVNGKITKGNIKITNLNFSYDYKNILKNINLEIKNNQKIIVIGESGSGKSTLFKLLMKYYKVGVNQIKIDGIDINNISNNEINNKISYISQNENLFTTTLYENLKLDSNIVDEEIEKVVNDVSVNEVMKENGYKMLIEENGFNLSGGEKMRIVLARTLLRKANIIIIDEGLSAVDINLERKILKNILKTNATIIFISHRIDNMDLFDRMIEMKKGKIIKDVSTYNTKQKNN